jgi:hypothetical protein
MIPIKALIVVFEKCNRKDNEKIILPICGNTEKI